MDLWHCVHGSPCWGLGAKITFAAPLLHLLSVIWLLGFLMLFPVSLYGTFGTLTTFEGISVLL